MPTINCDVCVCVCVCEREKNKTTPKAETLHIDGLLQVW